MIKKLFYFFLFFMLYLTFGFKVIEAKEYCHFYLNDTIAETVELPFYYYELKREPIFTTNMPTIKYHKESKYIDSLTKCELINLEIIFNDLYLTPAQVADFSYEEIMFSNEIHFENAKLKENGTILKGLSTNSDEEPPIISGYEEKYTSNVNNPIDLSMLVSYFSAHDNFDGNISNKIELKYEEYTKNTNNPGIYAIILGVEDSSSNYTTITFYIEVIDTTPPLIEGENSFTSLLSTPITIEDIQNNLKVIDNVDENLNSQLFVCNDTYTPNKKKIGTYSVYFCVYDSSNNLSNEFKVNILVKDDISPIIEGLNYFESKLSSPITIKEIMYSLAASDNGKDITDSIFITTDLYSSYQNTIGEKEIFFQAMDEEGNISPPFKVTINLIDDIAPQIFGLNIYTSYLSKPLSLTYLKQQLSVIDNYDGNITNKIKVINDSYSTNINNKGTFYITFQVEDYSSNLSEEFPVTITNIDDVAPYIIGPTKLTYELKNKPSLQTIISQYTTVDNVDDSPYLEIKQEDYSSSIQTGIFYIELSTQDSEGNVSSPFLATVEIVDKLIEINECSILLPAKKMYTQEEINKLLNFKDSYTLIKDTYTENYFIEGTYELIYELEPYKQIKITITTYFEKENKDENIDNIKLTTKQKKETFFSKIKSFFKKLFSSIKNFFKKIFL